MTWEHFRRPASARAWWLVVGSGLWAAATLWWAAGDSRFADRRPNVLKESAAPTTTVDERLVAVFAEPPPAYPISVAERIEERTVRIARRGTLVEAVMAGGAPRREAHQAAAALRGVFDARRLRAGQAVTILRRAPEERPEARAARLSGGAGLTFFGFQFSPSPEKTVRVIAMADGGFDAIVIEADLQEKPAFAAARISSSLYEAGDAADLPQPILAELIRIFSFDVDFQREIRRGDRFEVLYTNHHLPDGSAAKSGDVLFASLSVRGEPKAYYRFEAPGLGRIDYFDEKGASARKFLMRTPVDGARLSSGFGRRRHPILGYVKTHQGVDFAAPTGTPIMAAGDGVVERAARWGTYGKYVRIRHANGYKTAYAHLNGYARGIRGGAKVRQGQIIGYVGATGRATGPHLHYEVIKGGRRVNPMRLRAPTGVTLSGTDLDAFTDARAVIDAQMAPMRLAAASREAAVDAPSP